MRLNNLLNNKKPTFRATTLEKFGVSIPTVIMSTQLVMTIKSSAGIQPLELLPIVLLSTLPIEKLERIGQALLVIIPSLNLPEQLLSTIPMVMSVLLLTMAPSQSELLML